MHGVGAECREEGALDLIFLGKVYWQWNKNRGVGGFSLRSGKLHQIWEAMGGSYSDIFGVTCRDGEIEMIGSRRWTQFLENFGGDLAIVNSCTSRLSVVRVACTGTNIHTTPLCDSDIDNSPKRPTQIKSQGIRMPDLIPNERSTITHKRKGSERSAVELSARG